MLFPGLCVNFKVRTEESPVFPHPECNQLKFFCYDDISLACKSQRTPFFFFFFFPLCKILLRRVFPNRSDTPRPTNPGELNFLAEPVRLVPSSSGQTCFPLCSPWLLPPTRRANLAPTSHGGWAGRKHRVSPRLRALLALGMQRALTGDGAGKGKRASCPTCCRHQDPSLRAQPFALEQGGTGRDVFFQCKPPALSPSLLGQLLSFCFPKRGG